MGFWYKKIVSEYGNIPTVICGNKVDKSNRKVNKNIISHHIKYNTKYYDISAKSKYNCEIALMSIIELVGKEDSCALK